MFGYGKQAGCQELSVEGLLISTVVNILAVTGVLFFISWIMASLITFTVFYLFRSWNQTLFTCRIEASREQSTIFRTSTRSLRVEIE